jgi:hypothetical protein
VARLTLLNPSPPRRITPGLTADLCLLTQPLANALDQAVRTGEVTVLSTFIAGAMVYRRLSASRTD